MLGDCGMLAYLSYMADRLVEIRRVLKPTGSIYLHCDPTSSHYLKAIMDAVFGVRNFRNEVIWRNHNAHNSSDRFGPIHQTILFYSMSDGYRHRRTHVPYTKGYVDDFYKRKDDNGRRYRSSDLHGSGIRRNGMSGQSWRGYNPTSHGRHWAVPGKLVAELGIDPKLSQHEKLDALHELGFVHLPKTGLPTYRRYLDSGEGVSMQDIWAYQPYTKGALHNSKSCIDEDVKWLDHRSKAERMGYPTQKPLGLLNRIIEASSDNGDVVLDPFCGCGTTVMAARNLNRRFVGIDISHFAIDLVRDWRLMDRSVPVNGVPVDMHTAELMARDNPFEFEKWAVTRVPGMVPNSRQVGDGGIDGRGKLLDGGLVLAQVKGGKFALGQFRDFRHVIGRESADCGIFTTLRPVASPNAKREANAAGHIELGANRYPKVQFWSIADYFQNRLPMLPPLADPYTGKSMQQQDWMIS